MCVQHGLFVSEKPFRSAINAEVIAKPTIVGDQTSATMLTGIEREMDAQGLGLKTLANSYDVVFGNIGFDGAPTCNLTFDFIDERVPDNCILFKSLCGTHGLNRPCMDHLTKAGYDLQNPTFSLSHIMHIGGYFGSFAKVVVDMACTDVDWSQVLQPCRLEMDRHLEARLAESLCHNINKPSSKYSPTRVDFELRCLYR